MIRPQKVLTVIQRLLEMTQEVLLEELNCAL